MEHKMVFYSSVSNFAREKNIRFTNFDFLMIKSYFDFNTNNPVKGFAIN